MLTRNNLILPTCGHNRIPSTGPVYYFQRKHSLLCTIDNFRYCVELITRGNSLVKTGRVFHGNVSVQVVRTIVHLCAIRTRVLLAADAMDASDVPMEITGQRKHLTAEGTRKVNLLETTNDNCYGEIYLSTSVASLCLAVCVFSHLQDGMVNE
ncbi:hypothetical protein LSH36_19g07033 [Paralvinella palmiformis]|uniref:Uncharacterized protein n=1 Tax=Paralvinella palmiformis TaxID=53620 RepID=A0AAD9KBH8_9ANNE|nr:hypothetical protein LSH36_19g07033 [Paralvinella palmiformis]